MDYEYENNRHFKTRAVGQLLMGPIQRDGYDNRVMKLTVNELEFENSVEAERYLDSQRLRLRPRQLASRTRRNVMSSMLTE